MAEVLAQLLRPSQLHAKQLGQDVQIVLRQFPVHVAAVRLLLPVDEPVQDRLRNPNPLGDRV